MRYLRQLSIPLVLAALGLALPPVADAAERCSRDGVTVASTSQVRVWKVERTRDGVPRYYGCVRGIGRSVRLDPRGGFVIESPDSLKIAGTMVVFEAGYVNIKPYRIIVRNLRTRRVVHSHPVNEARSEIGIGSPGGLTVLKRNGSVAWTASVDCACEGTDPSENGWEVHAIDRDGRHQLLDSGTGVDDESLRLSADRRSVSWLNGGVRFSAPLR